MTPKYNTSRMETVKLIDRALYELRTSPFDAVHDERHHVKVWVNCRRIITREGLSGLNLDALKVATFWHDVQRDQPDEFKLLRETMQGLKTPKKEEDLVLAIASNHSYGTTQKLTEAKVLFDADKLEYVSTARARILLEEILRGNIPQERSAYYVSLWNKRIVDVQDNLHFGYTKNLFTRRLASFMDFASSHSELSVLL